MRVVADENGWELVDALDAGEPRPAGLASSMPPVSATVSSNAPGSGVFRKVEEVLDADEATMATDPAPASDDVLDADLDVRLPAPARLPPDLTGDKTRVA